MLHNCLYKQYWDAASIIILIITPCYPSIFSNLLILFNFSYIELQLRQTDVFTCRSEDSKWPQRWDKLVGVQSLCRALASENWRSLWIPAPNWRQGRNIGPRYSQHLLQGKKKWDVASREPKRIQKSFDVNLHFSFQWIFFINAAWVSMLYYFNGKNVTRSHKLYEINCNGRSMWYRYGARHTRVSCYCLFHGILQLKYRVFPVIRTVDFSFLLPFSMYFFMYNLKYNTISLSFFGKPMCKMLFNFKVIYYLFNTGEMQTLIFCVLN